MSVPIALIICTEPGRLEEESLLLVKSIRQFAGALKDALIYSFHPRSGKGIQPKTEREFEKLNVVHQQIPLNTEFLDYPLANKPLICSYVEQQLDAEILVFLDSDKCIFAEPSQLLLNPNFDIGLRPEFGKSIGSSGQGDSQEAYWQNLYQVFDVQREIFVNTPIADRRIRGYWNSGLITVRRSAGIFAAWESNFRKAMRLNIQPPQGIYMLEQSILAVTVCAMDVNVYTLPSSYNYALPLHNRFSKSTKLDRFDEIVSIHYFKMFAYTDWQQKLKRLKDLDCLSEKYFWMYEQLARSPKMKRSIWQDYIYQFRRIENSLKVLNPLHLGN